MKKILAWFVFVVVCGLLAFLFYVYTGPFLIGLVVILFHPVLDKLEGKVGFERMVGITLGVVMLLFGILYILDPQHLNLAHFVGMGWSFVKGALAMIVIYVLYDVGLWSWLTAGISKLFK